LYRALPASIDHCLIAQLPDNKRAEKIAAFINKKPLFDFGLEKEDALGVTLAIPFLKVAAEI
jgi:hypothetical protein